MSQEIQEAVQIIKVAYEGIEIAIKVGSGSIEELKKAIEFIKGILDYEKTLGKTSMKKLLMKGGDLQVLQFDSKEIKKVEKYAKKYGILYSILPDKNKDGLSELIFHSEAVPRANVLLQKMGKGRLATFDEFVKSNSESDLGKLINSLKKAGREGEKGVEEYSEIISKGDVQSRLEEYKEVASRIKAISTARNINLMDITISKLLIADENEYAIKTRVPGTWGENIRYVWINKEHIIDIHNGKTMLTFLDKNKCYNLYDSMNNIVETKIGEALYKDNYDRVESSVRKHYEKITRDMSKDESKNIKKDISRKRK